MAIVTVGIIWPISGGYQLLGRLPRQQSVELRTSTRNGATVVGSVLINTDTGSKRVAARWDGTAVTELTSGSLGDYVRADDISDDGNKISGYPNLQQWDRTGNLMVPTPPVGYTSLQYVNWGFSRSRGMSIDGGLTVGTVPGKSAVVESGVARTLTDASVGSSVITVSKDGTRVLAAESAGFASPDPVWYDLTSDTRYPLVHIVDANTLYAYPDKITGDGNYVHGRAHDTDFSVQIFGVSRSVFWDNLTTFNSSTGRYGTIHIKQDFGYHTHDDAGEIFTVGVSDYNNISVGWARNADASRVVAARWTGVVIEALQSADALDHAPTACQAWACSEYGDRVCGQAWDTGISYPVWWDADGLIHVLPTPTPPASQPFFHGNTVGISADGTLVYGYILVDEFDGVCIAPDPINAEPPAVAPAVVTPWALEPDWANGVTERLSWKTDVLASQTGVEQRRRLRNSPRRQIEAAFTLIGSDRRLYDNLMQGPAAGFWNYPLWWEKYPLTAPVLIGDTVLFVADTPGTEITSGDKLLITDRSPFVAEVVTVNSVTSGALGLAAPGLTKAWPAGTSVYLTKRCRLIGAQRGQRRADDAAQVTLTFETTEPNDYTGIAPMNALDYPILELLPNDAEDMTVEYKRLLAEFDNQTAAVPIRRDLASRAFMLQQFSYLTRGRAELAALRGFLYYLQGKLTPLYVPTYARDVELMPGSFGAPGDTLLAVRRSGYPDYTLDHNASRRLLMFWFRDGTVEVRLVTGANVVDDDQEALTLASPLDRGVDSSTVWRICWMALSRQDQDDIEILHHTDGRGAATMTTTFATIAEGRDATPYLVNVWNGSFTRTDGTAIPPPPDGGLERSSIDALGYNSAEVGGEGGDGGQGDADGQGGAEGADGADNG